MAARKRIGALGIQEARFHWPAWGDRSPRGHPIEVTGFVWLLPRFTETPRPWAGPSSQRGRVNTHGPGRARARVPGIVRARVGSERDADGGRGGELRLSEMAEFKWAGGEKYLKWGRESEEVSWESESLRV